MRFVTGKIMKTIGFVLFVFFTAFTISAQNYPVPAQIIREESKFIFTDGSSYYLFNKDGTFKSEPLGISGRTISGTWKVQDNLFTIEGKWGWVNGLSRNDDYRKMVVFINNPTSSEILERLSPSFGSLNVKIYKCYFEIEDLQKIVNPQNQS